MGFGGFFLTVGHRQGLAFGGQEDKYGKKYLENGKKTKILLKLSFLRVKQKLWHGSRAGGGRRNSAVLRNGTGSALLSGFLTFLQ